MRTMLLILCTVGLSGPAMPAPWPQPVTISGRVVAYSNSIVCLNGNVVWSTVIRSEEPKIRSWQFVRVDFSLACDKSPEWFPRRSKIQKFRLLRKRDCDTALTGTMRGEQDERPEFPVWKHIPGTEDISVPFGSILPCYRSVDLPLLPVV